jgi:hypothetical protein
LLAKRLAQLPRPVMSNRSNSSITINVDRRGAADADIQVKPRWCMLQRCRLPAAYICVWSCCERIALANNCTGGIQSC